MNPSKMRSEGRRTVDSLKCISTMISMQAKALQRQIDLKNDHIGEHYRASRKELIGLAIQLINTAADIQKTLPHEGAEEMIRNQKIPHASTKLVVLDGGKTK